MQKSSKVLKEFKSQLELERKKGLEQKSELQKQAAELQLLWDKEENLESELFQKNQLLERLAREVEQAKSELEEMKVTGVEAVFP